MVNKIRKYLEEELGGLADEEKAMELDDRAREFKVEPPRFEEFDDFYAELYRYYKKAATKAAKKFYAKIARDFDVLKASVGDVNVSFLKKLAQVIEKQKPKLVLDGGCGTAIDTCCLAILFPTIHFTGYDISDSLIQIAKERADRRNVKNIDFILAEHENIPLENESANLLYVNTALLEEQKFFPEEGYDFYNEYFEERVIDDRAEEFYRVLKKNGLLAYTVQSLLPLDRLPLEALMEMKYDPVYSTLFEGKGFRFVEDYPIEREKNIRLILLRK